MKYVQNFSLCLKKSNHKCANYKETALRFTQIYTNFSVQHAHKVGLFKLFYCDI